MMKRHSIATITINHLIILLIKNKNRYQYFPLTYNLPSEYTLFFEEFKKMNSISDSKVLWIMKPVSKFFREIIKNKFTFFV